MGVGVACRRRGASGLRGRWRQVRRGSASRNRHRRRRRALDTGARVRGGVVRGTGSDARPHGDDRHRRRSTRRRSRTSERCVSERERSSRRESRSQIPGRRATLNMRFRTSISAFGSARTPTSTHSACFRRGVPPTLLRHPRRRPPQLLRLLRRLCLHRPLSSRRRAPAAPEPSPPASESPAPSVAQPEPVAAASVVVAEAGSASVSRATPAPPVDARAVSTDGDTEHSAHRDASRHEGADASSGVARRNGRASTGARQRRRADLTAASPRAQLNASWSADRLPRSSASPISCGAARPVLVEADGDGGDASTLTRIARLLADLGRSRCSP